MKIYTCFPGGKAKALTMSYDDGKDTDERLLEIFNKNGIRGTFNLNYGIMTDDDFVPIKYPRIKADRIKELYKGHEIATHTMTHPTIARCPLTFVAKEVLEDRIGLEKLTGQIVRGHAYPNGSYSKEIKNLLASLDIAYARVVETKPDFSLPADPLEWKATCHHNDPKLMEYAKYLAELNKPQYLKLMYVWGHSYEFEDRNNWNVIEEFCEYMGHRDDIWYATNIEIIDYMEASSRLRFAADESFVYNPSACSVWINIEDGDIRELKGGSFTVL